MGLFNAPMLQLVRLDEAEVGGANLWTVSDAEHAPLVVVHLVVGHHVLDGLQLHLRSPSEKSHA